MADYYCGLFWLPLLVPRCADLSNFDACGSAFGGLLLCQWTMTPLFNLFIKMDKVARHALTKEESTVTNVVGSVRLIGGDRLFCSLLGHSKLFILPTRLFCVEYLFLRLLILGFIGTDKQQYALWSLIGLWGLGLAAIGSILINNPLGLTFWSTCI